jgi:pimeloyl-ACP methyl ester carboxylesterase
MFPTITPEIFKGNPMEDVRAITAPTLIIVGDSDVVRLDHVVELFRMLGGGVMGDLGGLPKSQLAVLPGTSHFMPPAPVYSTAPS